MGRRLWRCEDVLRLRDKRRAQPRPQSAKTPLAARMGRDLRRDGLDLGQAYWTATERLGFAEAAALMIQRGYHRPTDIPHGEHNRLGRELRREGQVQKVVDIYLHDHSRPIGPDGETLMPPPAPEPKTTPIPRSGSSANVWPCAYRIGGDALDPQNCCRPSSPNRIYCPQHDASVFANPLLQRLNGQH